MTKDVTYPAVITQDGTGPETPVTVRLPDFPAITAIGNSRGEALSEAEVRLQSMINDMAARGEQIPMPSQGSATGTASAPITVRVPEAEQGAG